MKLIVYRWKAYNEEIVINQLKHKGYEVIEFECELKHYTRDLELAQKLINLINIEHADAVFTINYLPIISIVCDTCKIKYYSWVFNSPDLLLFAKSVTYPCNRIATFDREQADLLKNSGCDTIFHLPLAVDCKYFEDAISNKENNKRLFGDKGYCDVEFLGSLYTENIKLNNYDVICKDVHSFGSDEELERWNRIEQLIRKQVFCYDKDYIRDISEEDYYFLLELLDNRKFLLDEDYYDFNDEVLFSSILLKRVTILERRELLCEIADYCNGKYDFRLYSGSDVSEVDKLKWCKNSKIDYENEMPLVFNRAKINLNITLRSIGSGIPLRVLDVLGCGGFLLTDPQPEVLEYFEEDKELVIYRSIEECLEKIDFYLKHEELRKSIAMAGKKAVVERFNYDVMLDKLFC